MVVIQIIMCIVAVLIGIVFIITGISFIFGEEIKEPDTGFIFFIIGQVVLIPAIHLILYLI